MYYHTMLSPKQMEMMFTQIYRWTVHLLQAAGGTQSTKDDKALGDETGVGVSKCNNIILCIHAASFI